MDIVSRGLSEAMKPHFPQPLAVVNRAGAAGTIGNAEVVRARPDGYTLGISAVAVLTVQPHRTKLPYQGPDTYAPINKLVNLAIVLAVRQDAPWKTAQEFLAAARQAPGKLRVSSPGIGTILHLILEDLKDRARVDVTHVPFRGNGEAIPALLGGHVEASVVHPGEIVPHVQAGKARVLMVFEPVRDPLFPDAPTARELGYDITLGVYYLLIGPKGTPPAVIRHDKRHPADMGAPEVRRFLTSLAVDGRVAASTQNQALSALLFLYRDVLGVDLPWLDGVVHAKGLAYTHVLNRGPAAVRSPADRIFAP